MRRILGKFAFSARARRGLAIGSAGLGSLASVALFLAVVPFNAAPGPDGAPPLHWPADSGITLTEGQRHLLFFVHPFCSCTHASITELSHIPELQRAEGEGITFLVFRPSGNSSWSRRALEETVRYLPASRLLWDDGGAEAKRFRIRTSGTLLLYSPRGRLLFHGGVTGSRGHEGGNYGIDTLARLLQNPPTADTLPESSRVFGCAL